MRILSELRLSTVIITDLGICIFVGSPDIYALLYISTHICVQIFIFLFGSRLYFYVCRYIGLLANITFDTGVRENVQKEKTSQLAASMFKQVSWAPALLINYHGCKLDMRNVRSQYMSSNGWYKQGLHVGSSNICSSNVRRPITLNDAVFPPIISMIFSWRGARWRIFTSCTRQTLKCLATHQPITSVLHDQADFFDNID